MSGLRGCWVVVDVIPFVRQGVAPHRLVEGVDSLVSKFRFDRAVLCLDCVTGQNWRTDVCSWDSTVEAGDRATLTMIEDLAASRGYACLDARRCSGLDVAGSLISLRPDLRFALVSSRSSAPSLLEKGRVTIAHHMLDLEALTWLTADGYREKSGLLPSQCLDYLTIVGGKGLVGVPGCGKKTALALLHQYHTWDGIVRAAETDTITGRTRDSVLVSAARFGVERSAWSPKLNCLVENHAWRCKMEGDGESRQLVCRCVMHEHQPLFYSLIPGTEADRTVAWVAGIIAADGFFDPLRHH